MRANDNSGEVEREQERETKDRQIMGQGGSGEKREIELSDISDGVGGASSAAEFINRAELPQSGRDSEVLLRKVGSYPPSIANGEIA